MIVSLGEHILAGNDTGANADCCLYNQSMFL